VVNDAEGAAAPVLPPVVPDSEALDPNVTFALPSNVVARYAATKVSGSGVVPDKPPLAPEPACSTCNDTRTVVVYVGGNDVGFTYDGVCHDCPDDAPVPAVTDDEAATEVLAMALRAADLLCGNGGHGLTLPVASDALRFLAALRANGYSLVRSTREDT
jgi:hypothetical protein